MRFRVCAAVLLLAISPASLARGIICPACAKNPALRGDYEKFLEARKARDWALADELIQKLAAEPGADLMRLEYFLRFHVDCERAFEATARMGDFSRPNQSRFDIAVCRAARLDATDPAKAEAMLSEAIDAYGGFMTTDAYSAYSRFATSPTPDLASLRFLKKHGLDGWSSRSNYDLQEKLSGLDADAIDAFYSLGFDANQPIGVLPLQVVREESLKNEPAALAAARVLVAHGADANMLAWFQPDKAVKGTPAMEALLAEEAAKIDPVRIDFLGLARVLEPHGVDFRARIRVGNASPRALPVSAWVAGEHWVCGGGLTAYAQYRPQLGKTWRDPMFGGGDGPAPEGVSVRPNESAEFLCQMSLGYARAGSEYRVVFNFSDGSTRYSSPFRINETTYDNSAEQLSLPDFEEWH